MYLTKDQKDLLSFRKPAGLQANTKTQTGFLCWSESSILPTGIICAFVKRLCKSFCRRNGLRLF